MVKTYLLWKKTQKIDPVGRNHVKNNKKNNE